MPTAPSTGQFPERRNTFSKNSIPYPQKNMKKKVSIMLVALVVLDIVDGDFVKMSALDIVKLLLYIVCFALLIMDGRKERQ